MAENRKQRKQTRKESHKRAPRRRPGRVVRGPADPLGYDTREFWPMVDRMLDDVRSGRTIAAVDAELSRIRARYKTAKQRDGGTT
jgi:hypothetical protein